MFRAVVWKEFREQGLIGLTLLVLGSGILAAVAAFADPPAGRTGAFDVIRALGAGRLATLMLAVTAGMVTGGALFAAEREAGTIGFLEALPVSRWRLWRAKLAAGTLLAGGQIAVVVAVAAALGLVAEGWVTAAVVYAGLAFAWGAFGSTIARTTLGAVGVAIPFASLATFVYMLPVMIFFAHPGTAIPRAEGGLLFLGLMLVTPVTASALAFTRQDRARAADALPPRAEAAAPEPRWRRPVAPWLGGTALLWLTARQFARPTLVLSGVALFLGVTLLPKPVPALLFWWCHASLLGVLAGVTTFADEQSGGAARFWGERRLPVGRLWAVKVLAGAALALWLGLVLLLPAAVLAEVRQGTADAVRGRTYLATALRTLMLDEIHPYTWTFAVLPLAYGFAAGQLCVLLFRKVALAVSVAGLVGATAAFTWLPSLLAGGLSAWQLALPPAVALATARSVVSAWATDRLATRRPVRRVGLGVAGVLVAMAAGLGWRAVEVPANPAAEADVRLVDALPSFDANEAGRALRGAAERFARVQADAHPAAPGGSEAATPSARRAGFDAALGTVLRHGWPYPAADDGAWLDAVYADRATATDLAWFDAAADATAPGKPVGMFEHPRQVVVTAHPELATAGHARLMGRAIVVRGLQEQARGDPAAFVAALHTALGLAANLDNGGVVGALLAGLAVEQDALTGVDRWLERLPAGRADLLRPVLGELRAADAAAFDPTPHLLAERYHLRETMKAPAQWLPEFLTPAGGDKEQVGPEPDWVATAWAMPWEKERLRRLVGLGYEAGGRRAAPEELVRGRPGVVFFLRGTLTADDLIDAERRLRVFRRAAILKVALRLYLADHRRPAGSLDELVPAYLPAVPADPYGASPFRYRLSAGERLPAGWSGMGRGRSRRLTDVPAGQGVLWSVGPDGKDGGGTRLLPDAGDAGLPEDDPVFLVPLPAADPAP